MPEEGKVEIGSFVWASNRAQVVWQGLPFMAPHIQAKVVEETGYLFAGLVPNLSIGRPAPTDLLKEIVGRTNLLFYQWELTGERVRNWRDFLQLAPLFLDVRAIPNSETGQQWMETIHAILGNTVTEMTLETPREITLNRKGPLSLTGFETLLLCRWIDLMDLPQRTYKVPRPMPREAVILGDTNKYRGK
jgi:hypothetical protein